MEKNFTVLGRTAADLLKEGAFDYIEKRTKKAMETLKSSILRALNK